MESMPILHANRLFTILFEDDLAFTEVRAVLDHLLDRNAFRDDVRESDIEYHIDLDQASFDVWVHEMDVIIQRR